MCSQMTGGFDLKQALKAMARGLALYADDLLMVAGGVCFTAAAAELAGRPAALIVGGACLVAYAVVIARARRGGRR